MLAPMTMAASSKSLFVRCPDGLDEEAKEFCTDGENAARHKMGAQGG